MAIPLSRRLFLNFVAAAGVSTYGKPLTSAGADRVRGDHEEVGKRIYKSLKWTMVHIEGGTQEKFSALKEIGYDGVELIRPGGVEAQEAIQASEMTGLPIEGIVNSTHWKVRHSDPNPHVRDRALANMREAMRYAKEVGAESVLLVPGKVTDDEHENHDQVWQRSIGAIGQLTPLAESLQIQILIENVGNGFCETPQLFAQYIDAIDHPLVGVHFDIGNHVRVSPPSQWIRVLGKRIKKLDVKDRTTANERTLVGEGDADWAEVRKALQALDYRGWAAAEVPGGDQDRLADVLARMNRVLGPSDGNPSSLKP